MIYTQYTICNSNQKSFTMTPSTPGGIFRAPGVILTPSAFRNSTSLFRLGLWWDAERQPESMLAFGRTRMMIWWFMVILYGDIYIYVCIYIYDYDYDYDADDDDVHSQYYLIGSIPTPWKIWKSDWIIIPTIAENKIHVPNHLSFWFLLTLAKPLSLSSCWLLMIILIMVVVMMVRFDQVIALYIQCAPPSFKLVYKPQ